jgi:hypothetical protein
MPRITNVSLQKGYTRGCNVMEVLLQVKTEVKPAVHRFEVSAMSCLKWGVEIRQTEAFGAYFAFRSNLS